MRFLNLDVSFMRELQTSKFWRNATSQTQRRRIRTEPQSWLMRLYFTATNLTVYTELMIPSSSVKCYLYYCPKWSMKSIQVLNSVRTDYSGKSLYWLRPITCCWVIKTVKLNYTERKKYADRELSTAPNSALSYVSTQH